jgi:hypothetical protein
MELGEGCTTGEGGVPTRGILIPWLEMPEPQQLLPQNSAPAPADGDLRSSGYTPVLARPPGRSVMPASPQTPTLSSRFQGLGRGALSSSQSLLPPAGDGVHCNVGRMGAPVLGGGQGRRANWLGLGQRGESVGNWRVSTRQARQDEVG